MISGKKRVLFAFAFILCCMMMFPQYAMAEMQVLFLTQQSELKAEPDGDSETVTVLEEGSAVIVLENIDAEWNKVQNGEYIGYIQQNFTTDVNVEVAQEMAGNVNNDDIKLMEAEYKISQYKQTIIWGGIIIALIIAIFATGIISTIKKEKNRKGK